MRTHCMVVVALVIATLWSLTAADVASVVMTMLCRDEDVNLKANLLNWVRVVDYFVFVVDKRTIDESVKTIESILSRSSKKYKVVWNDFTGFGAARTLSLETAWNSFPNASHVLIADPDWLFDLKTIDKTVLSAHSNADVFRFTIYDAEREGRSHTRKMDWLLKNKPGLSMKYNLHEVLSIGEYTAVHIPWEVREVAKEGTWHSTVGHGDSASGERYKFDLDLLYKDLAQYNHDPHVHYYLGTTHQSYATKAQHSLGLYSDEVQHHIDQAIHFHELRARSSYDEELPEQRWAALIELGNIYTSLRIDDLKAIYWLSTCRDYNPAYIECPMLLAQFYVSLGQLAPALVTLDTMLRTPQPAADARRTSQFLGLWECDAPLVVLDVMSKKAQFQGVSPEEAMHFFTLYQARKSKNCKQTSNMNRAVRAIFNKAVDALSVDYFESPHNFCESPLLQQYLTQKEYALHPCDAYRQSLAVQKLCEVFSVTVQPAYEEFQVNAFQKHFMGAAIVPDIVHHVFQGNSSRFLSKRRQMRFLFAEHFEVQMVFNLMGQLHRAKITDYRIEVLSPETAVREEYLSRTETCREYLPASQKQQVFFQLATLQEYLQAIAPGDGFDYIEYNGGLSKAAQPQEELAALARLLRDDTGVLGLTYFTHNHHTARLRALVDGRNASFMVPFSLEATRLVHAYLDQHKLGQFKTDRELVALFGGDERESSAIRTSLKQIVPRVQWSTYTREESQSMLADAGLAEVSRLPTAYTHPFGEVSAFGVLKYKSYGLSEDQFTEDMMTSFRNTVYTTKITTAVSVPTGRRALTLDAFNRSLVPADVLIVDRMRTLGTTFQDIESMAARSPSIDFQHYALPGDTKLSHIVTRSIAPCLPHLSSKPSLRGLHTLNKQYAARNNHFFDEVAAQRELLEFLSYLEKLNFLTYETNTPDPEAKGFRGATLNSLHARKSAIAGAGSTSDRPVEEKKVGGLSFKVPSAGINVKALPELLQKKKAEIEAERQAASTVKQVGTAPPASPPSKEEEVPRSGDLGTDSAQLSYVEQVARMRALGYSESMIEELLDDESPPASMPSPESAAATASAFAALEATAARQSAEVSSSGEATKEGKSAKSVIDLLTRFTANRAAKSTSADKIKQDATDASTLAHISDDIPPITKGPPVDATPVLSFKMSKKEIKPEPELILAGGLKLPKTAARNIIVPPAPQIKISDVSDDLQLSRKLAKGEVAKRSLRADQIHMPSLQSASTVLNSYRRLECASSAASTCQEPRVLKRKTSHGSSTSARKLEFDAAQLTYLQSQRTLKLADHAQSALGTIEKSYIEVAKYLEEFKLDDPYRVVRLSSNSALKSKTTLLNRLVHLQEDPGLGAEALVHAGAIQYLHSIRNELLAHDFVVVDVILKEAALRELSRLLLSSTVWFDVTNGAAFAAHHNDGLAFPSVHTLVQQVALALSSDDRPLSVTSYYSLAMGLQHPAHSPVFMGNKDDLNVVLWLNPPSTQSPAPSSAFDGLRIYDESSAGRLFSQGVSVYPSAHCDFLSRSSSLAIDLHARCNSSNSEFVPRVANRLVVVRSKKLCTLLTPGDARLRGAGFDQSTMIALVMVLTPSV